MPARRRTASLAAGATALYELRVQACVGQQHGAHPAGKQPATGRCRLPYGRKISRYDHTGSPVRRRLPVRRSVAMAASRPERSLHGEAGDSAGRRGQVSCPSRSVLLTAPWRRSSRPPAAAGCSAGRSAPRCPRCGCAGRPRSDRRSGRGWSPTPGCRHHPGRRPCRRG